MSFSVVLSKVQDKAGPEVIPVRLGQELREYLGLTGRLSVAAIWKKYRVNIGEGFSILKINETEIIKICKYLSYQRQ